MYLKLNREKVGGREKSGTGCVWKYSSVEILGAPRISADRDLADIAQPAKQIERLALAAACTRKKSLKAPR